ncbi:MAG: hypothetical protein K6B44_00155 [Lachnospiraceae bacterium]|nr:hypothetical protein [Lachnospiraceae bacterium]
MPITDANYERFLTGLGGNAVSTMKNGRPIPQDADAHRYLLSRIAYQRKAIVGSDRVDVFLEDMMGADYRSLITGKTGDMSYLSMRPSVPAAVLRGVLLNRGVSLTQMMKGDIDPQIKRQVGQEFREACTDSVKMGKMVAEALKGVAAFDINREFREALGEPGLVDQEVAALIGTDTGRVMTAVYLSGFKNMAQEIKQFGDHVMQTSFTGAFYTKQKWAESLGPMGNAFMAEISDEDLAAYWKISHLADAIGAPQMGPEMLIGYYTSSFYNPQMVQGGEVNGFSGGMQTDEALAQKSLFGAMVAQEIGIMMSKAGKAGNLSCPGRKYYMSMYDALQGKVSGSDDVNRVLSDPLTSVRIMNETLNPADRLERELAIAAKDFHDFPKSVANADEKGMKIALSSMVTEISEDRLEAELAKPVVSRMHPFNLAGLPESEQQQYISKREEWGKICRDERQRLEAELKTVTDEGRKAEIRKLIERNRKTEEKAYGEAKIVRDLSAAGSNGFDPDMLLEEPELRPQLKAALIEKGRIWALVSDECRKICEKEGNGKSFNDFFDADNRDMAYLCTIPESITDDEARRAYVRDWVKQWNDKPEGRKKCLDEFYDMQDRLAAENPDLSCLSEADESELMSDGLTKSEHDLMDMLYLRSSSQTAVHEGPTLNPAYFKARYAPESALAVFDALKGAKMGGLDIYLNQVMSLNGMEADALKPAERGRIGGYTAATMRNMTIAFQRGERELAAALGKTPSDVSASAFIFNAEYMGQPGYDELEAEKSTIVGLIDKHQRGETLTDTEIYTASSIFEANIGTVAGYGSSEYEKKRKDFDVDLIDTIFVDGKPLREFVGNKYGDPSAMNDAQRQALDQKYMAEAALAAMSGEHRVEYAEILKDKEGKPLVNLVSVKMDMHALDAAENRAHHNMGRRAFNFGLTKITTRADKADQLWADDPDKETRKALAVATLYQTASRNRAAVAVRSEWESNKDEVTAQTEAQKAQDAATKAAHMALLNSTGRHAYAYLSAAEYQDAMLAEFQSLPTAREKAGMLLDLVIARSVGALSPAEAEAANNFMVLGLLDRQVGGAVSPNGTRDIFREFARLQSEAAFSLGQAYTQKLAAYGSAPGAEAKAMLEVTGTLEGYENYMLEAFSPDSVLGLIDPDKLTGEAAQKYALLTSPNRVFPDGFVTSAQQVYDLQMDIEAASMTEAQKSIGLRMQEALEPYSLEAAGLSEDELDASVMSVQGKIAADPSQFTAYRLRVSEQILLDTDSIYDTATMSEFLLAVRELPGINEDPWLKAEMNSLSNLLTQLKDEKVVPDNFREQITDLMIDLNEAVFEMKPEDRSRFRAAYAQFRVNSGLQEKINAQPFNAAMGRLEDAGDVYAMDQLFARMQAEDMADPKHKNSAEYQAMFDAVKAVHEAAALFDPANRDSRARMAELMEKVKETSHVYAEAEAYKKKNGEIGIARKNSALMALSLASGGAEPDLARVKDLRLDRRGKKASDPQTMMQRLFAEVKAKYGAVTQTERDAKKVATSVERQNAASAKLERLGVGIYRRANRRELEATNNSFGIKNFRKNNPAFFGLDGSLFDESGLKADAELPADAAPEQKAMFEKLKKLQKSTPVADDRKVISFSEQTRGGFGGTRNLATLCFLNECREKGLDVSLADVLDPDKFTEEKRIWGEKVVDAMLRAKADPPETKDFAAVIGTAMKAMNSLDVKGETLKFIGCSPDLPAEEAAAAMNDKANFTKVASIIRAHADLALGAYQAMQATGLSPKLIFWDNVDFSKKDPQTGALTAEAFTDCFRPGKLPGAEILPFMQQVAEAAGENELVKFGYSKQATQGLAKAKMIGEFVLGSKRSFSTQVDENARNNEALTAAVAFYEMVNRVSRVQSISDPALYDMHMRMLDASQTQIGTLLAGDEPVNIDRILLEGLSESQMQRYNAKVAVMLDEYVRDNPKIVGERQKQEERLKEAQIHDAAKAPAAEPVAPAAPAAEPEAPAEEVPQNEGVEFLSKLTGVPADALGDYETFYHALDTVYVNGLSATEYFKETMPELHIDDDYDPLAIGAEEAVGKKLKAFIDAAKDDAFTAVFVAVEDESGLLRVVEAPTEGLTGEQAANAAEYNRIGERMYTDMNKLRLEALEGKRKQTAAAQGGPDAPTIAADEQARMTTLETAVNVSEGRHRRVAGGLSGLMKMEGKIRAEDKPDYSALASARRQAQKTDQAAVKPGQHQKT